MTPATPPAVSEAMREAVAREIHDYDCRIKGLLPWLDLVSQPNGRRGYAATHAYTQADAILSGPIASEIARLTGERDEVREAFMRVAEAIGAPASERLDLEVRDRLRAAEADLTRMRAETERLRAVLQDCRNTIANPNDGICCTIWFDDVTTLQDHIDLALAVNQKPAEVPLLAALSNPDQTDA